MARVLGGRYLLRIEDIDTARTRQAYVDAALEDLAWLGVRFDGPILRQSQQFDVYRAAAERLAGLGLLYPCFAARTDIAAAADPARRDPDWAPLYPGLWRNRAAAEVAERRMAGEPFALRLDMARACAVAATRLGDRPLTFTEIDVAGRSREILAAPERWGDAVIVRKETPTSYHLSVVVDDARQGVTHVTRGMDLFPATDLHRLLQVLLDLPAPAYHHHALITDDRGRKLSKSAGDTALSAWRARGITATEVCRRALAGTAYAPMA